MSTAPSEEKLAKATFPNMLERYKNEIARALPRHLNPDRMCRIALTEFRKNPRLAQCDPRSVFAAIIIASQLGLEPGVLGQCYLIPYGKECQLIIGYQGLVDLVRRSGLVSRIEAHVVRQGEKFTYKTGLKTILEHEPTLEGTPGPLRLAYAVAEFKDGGYHTEVMAEDQINRIRDRSQAVINAHKYGKTTAWDTDTEEMWRKTILRRICKYLPKSPELATAFSLEEAAAQGRQAITVEDAVAGTWEAPVIEVTTEGQDQRLAEKSKANLEEIKEKYQADPARVAQLQQEAERQKAALAQKYGANQPGPESAGSPVAVNQAESTSAAAPPNQQPEEMRLPVAVKEGEPESGDPGEPSLSEWTAADEAWQQRRLEDPGVPNIFDPPRGKRKRS